MIRLGVMGTNTRKRLASLMGRKPDEAGRVGWTLNIKPVFGRTPHKYAHIGLLG